MEECVKCIMRDQISKLSIQIDQQQLKIHRFLGLKTHTNDMKELKEIMVWLKTLVEANDTKKYFEPDNFRKGPRSIWFMMCYRSSTYLGLQIIPFYFSAPITMSNHTTFSVLLKFLLKSIIGMLRIKSRQMAKQTNRE